MRIDMVISNPRSTESSASLRNIFQLTLADCGPQNVGGQCQRLPGVEELEQSNDLGSILQAVAANVGISKTDT